MNPVEAYLDLARDLRGTSARLQAAIQEERHDLRDVLRQYHHLRATLDDAWQRLSEAEREGLEPPAQHY